MPRRLALRAFRSTLASREPEVVKSVAVQGGSEDDTDDFTARLDDAGSDEEAFDRRESLPVFAERFRDGFPIAPGDHGPPSRR